MKTLLLIAMLIAAPVLAIAGGGDDVNGISPLEEYIRQARASTPAAGGQGPSLFSPNSASLFLFIDVKARNVNDIVTIQIMETAAASNSANNDSNCRKPIISLVRGPGCATSTTCAIA